MTTEIPPGDAAEDEVCPHCGAALALARAMREDRSLLADRRKRTTRRA